MRLSQGHYNDYEATAEGIHDLIVRFEYPLWPNSTKDFSLQVIDDSHPMFKVALIDDEYVVIPIRKDGTYFCPNGKPMCMNRAPTMERLLNLVGDTFTKPYTIDRRMGHSGTVGELKCVKCNKPHYYAKSEHYDPVMRRVASSYQCFECLNDVSAGLPTRICPTCKVTVIEYDSIKKRNAAEKRAGACRVCYLKSAQEKRAKNPRKYKAGCRMGAPRVYSVPENLTRTCPDCQTSKVYPSRERYLMAQYENRKCRVCFDRDRRSVKEEKQRLHRIAMDEKKRLKEQAKTEKLRLKKDEKEERRKQRDAKISLMGQQRAEDKRRMVLLKTEESRKQKAFTIEEGKERMSSKELEKHERFTKTCELAAQIKQAVGFTQNTACEIPKKTWGRVYTKEELTRRCPNPNCNAPKTYHAKDAFEAAVRKNSLCLKCAAIVRTSDPEYRKKQAARMKGRTFTDEHRANIKAAAKRVWDLKKGLTSLVTENGDTFVMESGSISTPPA